MEFVKVKIYKTPSYIRKCVNKYDRELKINNPMQYQKRSEYFRQYQATKYYYKNENDFLKCIKNLF